MLKPAAGIGLLLNLTEESDIGKIDSLITPEIKQMYDYRNANSGQCKKK